MFALILGVVSHVSPNNHKMLLKMSLENVIFLSVSIIDFILHISSSMHKINWLWCDKSILERSGLVYRDAAKNLETWHLCVQREEELSPHNHHSQQICQVSGETVWLCLMPTFPDCFPTAGSSTPRGWPSGLTASWTSRTSPWIVRDVLLKSDHVSKLWSRDRRLSILP